MYRFFLAFFLCLFLAAACKAPQEKDPSPFQAGSFRDYQHSAQVRVSIHPEEIPVGSSPEELLWSRAENSGMTEIMNHWLSQRLLLQPVKAQVYAEGVSFLERKGQLSVSQEEQTGIYTQEFALQSRFVPVKQVSGSIVNLQDQYSIGGQFQHVSIELKDTVPEGEKAYFLVASKAAEDGAGRYKLLGGGRIHHVLDKTAQGMLMETKQEVKPGDLVFLLKSSVQPVAAKQDSDQQRTSLPEKEEVLVEPKQTEQEPEEKGSK